MVILKVYMYHLIFYQFCLMSYVYINIHEFFNEIIRIFIHVHQITMSQLIFGTKSCSLS